MIDMKRLLFAVLLMIGSVRLYAQTSNADPVTLSTGAKAPDFKLQGIDGKTYSLANFSGKKALVIIFSCNH